MLVISILDTRSLDTVLTLIKINSASNEKEVGKGEGERRKNIVVKLLHCTDNECNLAG